MQEGGSLKKLSSDCVCFLRGIGSKITKLRGRMEMEVQEEKVPNRHLGESQTEVFQLVSVPLYTTKKNNYGESSAAFVFGSLSINTEHIGALKVGNL